MMAGMFYNDVLLHVSVLGPLVFSDSVCFMYGNVGLCRLVELLLGCDTFCGDGWQLPPCLDVTLGSLPGPD